MPSLNSLNKADLIKKAEDLGITVADSANRNDIIRLIEKHKNVDHQEEFDAPKPGFGSTEWTDYVLGLMTDDELVEGRPRVEGLRRVFNELVCSAYSNDVNVIQAPCPENERRATVVYTLDYTDSEGQKRTITDAADCSWKNTKAPYSNYPVSTAVSMAEARCLRKALRIQVISEEEAMSPDGEFIKKEEETADLMTSIENMQYMTILRICQKLDINVTKFGVHKAGNENFQLKLATQSQARDMIKALNNYNNKTSPIPEGIRGWDDDIEESL